jgi:protocatechuate 3,4-dioxygenase beta subunit
MTSEISGDTQRIPAGAGAPTAIRGQVRDGGGRSIADAVLTLVDAAGRQIARSRTEQSGDYELHAPAPGTYVLIASAPAHQPQASTAAVGGRPLRLDVVLSGASTLGGRVLSAGDAVLPGAVLTLADARGEVIESVVSGEQGDYAFTSLVSGAYTLAVSAESHRPSAFAVSAADGQDTRLDVTLAVSASIAGRIRLDGPVAGADITVTLVDGAGDVVRVTSAGEGGSYTFHDLEPGSYTVMATSYAPTVHQVTVSHGEQVTHDVQLG